MTDEEIIEALKSGETINFGCNGRNAEIMKLMANLEREGLVEIRDMGLIQETRREAWWVGGA